jgi:predicted ABC-type exoprotein transport system permease subunit
MTPGDQAQPNVEALLQREQRLQQWLQDARRSHTKNLFGLWLLLVLLVIGMCVPIFVEVLREEFSLLALIFFLYAGLVVLTGAYTFQEVARIHRRIDAILKLLEERGTK